MDFEELEPKKQPEAESLDAQKTEQVPAPKPGKKNHIMVVVFAMAMLAIGVGAGLVLSRADDDTADTDQDTSEVVSQEQPAATPEVSTASSGFGLFKSSYMIVAQDGCEESGNFVDVTKFDGPGGDYAAPEFSVTCTSDELNVTSNNMPLWEFVALTPNALQEKDFSWTIPRNPEIAETPTQIGYQDAANSTLGDLGFTVSGLVWYGPTEGPQPDPYGDPFTNAIIDDCGGHTGPSGEYHEHIIVTKCFFPDWTEDQPAPIVGYALDGFPIYGPTGKLSADDSSVVTFKSAYKQTGDIKEYAWDNVEYVADQGMEYLDECNGRVQPDGSYGYHLTAGFPYIIGCFKGAVTIAGPAGGAAGPPPR